MSVLHICEGPTWERSTAPDDRPTRWCFNCRKHLPHTWSLMDYPLERQPSYYDPVPVCCCSRCKRDCTTFPGMEGGPVPSPPVWDELVTNAEPIPESVWENLA